MPRPFRYAWPGSAIDAALMHSLYMARESSPEPMTITRLIAEAVRAAYGQTQAQSETHPIKENHNETDHPHIRTEECRCRPLQGREPARQHACPELTAA